MKMAGERRGLLSLLLQFCRPRRTEDELSAQKKAGSRKKKSKKVLLMEMEEEESESEMRENLQAEGKKERNFWIKNIKDLEDLRHAETKVYEALIREESDKMEKELERRKAVIEMDRDKKVKLLETTLHLERERWQQEREKTMLDVQNERRQFEEFESEMKTLHGELFAMMEKELERLKAEIEMDRDKKIEQLEAAMDLERERWRQEREKAMLDLQNERNRCAEIERQKLEIEASWVEHTNNWAQKLLEKDNMLEEMTEVLENLKRTVEELKKEAEQKELSQTETMEDVKGKVKKLKAFHKLDLKHWLQKKSTGKLKEVCTQDNKERRQMLDEWQKEREGLEFQQRESEAREARTREEMEALVKEMDGMKTRFQAETDRMVSEFERESKNTDKEKDGSFVAMRNSMKIEAERKIREVTVTLERRVQNSRLHATCIRRSLCKRRENSKTL